MKAVIPAGGLGTRMLAATHSMPKAMLPVVDKPVIQYVVEEAVESGCDEILIVTGPGARAIQDHFGRTVEVERQIGRNPEVGTALRLTGGSQIVNIHYVQQDAPRGLGHAVLCARNFVGNEPFAVLLADDIVRGPVPATKQLMDVHDQTGLSAVGGVRVSGADISRYGVFGLNEEFRPGVYRVRTLEEKPAAAKAPSDLAVVGRYVLTPRIFSILAAAAPGLGGEIQLTEALANLAIDEGMSAVLVSGQRLDAGDTWGWLKANMEVAWDTPDLQRHLSSFISSRERQAHQKRVAMIPWQRDSLE
ncbi:MAG: UTP--glucose-1-phosphate uridylyltransferase [bacterium]